MNNTNEIAEYRKKYNEYFRSKVLPGLDKYEALRTKKLNTFKVVCIAVVVVAIIVAMFSQMALDDIFYIAAAIILGLYALLKKPFEKEIKKGIMSTLMSAFGDFHWNESPLLEESVLKESKIFEPYNYKKDDDNFYGSYKGVRFVISEIELCEASTQRKNDTVFDGLAIHLDMNKNFEGQTLIVNKHFSIRNKGNLQKVTLEDPEFNSARTVYSHDQVESRYLLTTAFMERYKALATVFETADVQCSFKDSKILLAINVNKDLFALGSLFKPVNDTEQYEQLFNQITAIFNLIDVLKLNMKIGL